MCHPPSLSLSSPFLSLAAAFFFIIIPFFNHFYSPHWLLIFQKRKCRKIYNWSHCNVHDDDGIGGSDNTNNNYGDDNVRPNHNGFISLLWFHNALGKWYLNLTNQCHWYVTLRYAFRKSESKVVHFFPHRLDSANGSHVNSHSYIVQ